MNTVAEPFDELLEELGYAVELPILRHGIRGIGIAAGAGGARALVTVVGPGVVPGALESVAGWDLPLLEARPIETVGGERSLLVEALPQGIPSTVGQAVHAVPAFAVELAERVAAAHENGAAVGYLHPDLVMVDPSTGLLAGVAQRPVRADAAAEPIDGARRFFDAAFATPSEIQGRVPGPEDDVFRLAAFAWRWRHGTDPFAGAFPDRLERTVAGTPGGGADDELDALLIECFAPDPSARPSATALAARLAAARDQVPGPGGG